MIHFIREPLHSKPTLGRSLALVVRETISNCSGELTSSRLNIQESIHNLWSGAIDSIGAGDSNLAGPNHGGVAIDRFVGVEYAC